MAEHRMFLQFKSCSTRDRHNRTVHGTKSFTCCQCISTLLQKNKLQCHMKSTQYGKHKLKEADISKWQRDIS